MQPIVMCPIVCTPERSSRSASMRLAHLTVGPTAPARALGPQPLVTAEDQRIEYAVAQGLLPQRSPSRCSRGRKQLMAAGQFVQVFADDRRIEQRLPVIRH